MRVIRCTKFHFSRIKGSWVITISMLNFWTGGGAIELVLETPKLVRSLFIAISTSVPNFIIFPCSLHRAAIDSHWTNIIIIKAASSIKRGSCFEGIRVCFYGVGQPWFMADSETHQKWTTGSQKHTHKHMFNCLLIIIDLESLENSTAHWFEVIYLRNTVFWGLFHCYSTTYGPISLKLCMAVKSHLKHVFTNFRKVLSFRLGFTDLWLYVTKPNY